VRIAVVLCFATGCGLVIGVDPPADAGEAGSDSASSMDGIVPPEDGAADSASSDALLPPVDGMVDPVDGMVDPDAPCPDCYFENASARCVAGVCEFGACDPGFFDEDGVPGCECYERELCSGVDDDCDTRVDEGWLVERHHYGGHQYLLCNNPTSGRDWVWSTTGAPTGFMRWGSRPNNFGGLEHCVELVPFIAAPDIRGMWNDLRCDDERAYICEQP